MSTHGAPGPHAAPHDHVFDGEPARALPPDEPMTPGWLPILGVGLFVCAAVWFLAISGGDPAEAAAAAASASAAEAAPAPPPPAEPVQAARPTPTPRREAVPGVPVPGPSASAAPAASARRLSKDDLDKLRKRPEPRQAHPAP